MKTALVLTGDKHAAMCMSAYIPVDVHRMRMLREKLPPRPALRPPLERKCTTRGHIHSAALAL